MTSPLPDLDLTAIRETARANAAELLRTPVAPLHGATTHMLLGPSNAWLKLELFQRTGTFKARGALAAVRRLSATERERGVTSVSAGNHAVAVAFAAKQAGLSAKIVIMPNANAARVELARSYGAELVTVPTATAAFERVQAITQQEGRSFIHPFDSESAALGAATVGLELAEQVPHLEVVLVSVGGGGLAGGVAAAVRKLLPRCHVIGVEPEGANVMQLSFKAGAPQRLESVSTIADSLAPPMTLPMAYGLCRRHLERVVTVSDDEICRAMAVLFRDAKLAVEPAGAVALAGMLGPLRDELRGARVGLIVCGANIDAPTFAMQLGRGDSLLPTLA